MTKNEKDRDWYMPSVRAKRRTAITPRVVLIDQNKRVPLLPYRGFWGLFGGHITIRERNAIQNVNLLDIMGSFPTIVREVFEEAGHDISQYFKTKAACLGLAEVTIVDQVTHTITDMLSPIFVCLTPTLEYEPPIQIFTLNSLPSNLYPDAALALKHLRLGAAQHRSGGIFPEWLNEGRRVEFINERNGGRVVWSH